MAQNQLQVRRVQALPGTLAKDTIYFVQSGTSTCRIVVTDNAGTPTGYNAGIVPKGDYSGATAYVFGDVVRDQGAAWMCILGGAGTAPPTLPTSSNTHWGLLASGTPGEDGWSPVFAVVTDGERRVLQVSDWTGGTGTKPTIGQYVSATGLTSTLASAIDIRGPAGADGDGAGDVVGPASATDGAFAAFDGPTGKLIKSSGYLPREVLTANRTYYVRTDGNDGNDGLTNNAGGAFATIQKAVTAALALDFSTFNVTIQLADGIYTAGALFAGAWGGSGALTIQGNTSDATKVSVNVTASSCFNCTGLIPSSINLAWLTMSVTGVGHCIRHTGSGVINYGNVVFGPCGANHCYVAAPTAQVIATANYWISGGAQRHLFSQGGMISTTARTISFLNNAAFSAAFVEAFLSGGVVANAMTFSLGAFAATGKRYGATQLSYIFTSGGGANYFPGNSAGTSDASSVYS